MVVPVEDFWMPGPSISFSDNKKNKYYIFLFKIACFFDSLSISLILISITYCKQPI